MFNVQSYSHLHVSIFDAIMDHFNKVSSSVSTNLQSMTLYSCHKCSDHRLPDCLVTKHGRLSEVDTNIWPVSCLWSGMAQAQIFIRLFYIISGQTEKRMTQYQYLVKSIFWPLWTWHSF